MMSSSQLSSCPQIYLRQAAVGPYCRTDSVVIALRHPVWCNSSYSYMTLPDNKSALEAQFKLDYVKYCYGYDNHILCKVGKQCCSSEECK